ncbi:carotenoid 1,2-hydratase [Alkalisalibacterium limincola]|uniref:Carotenoid 1,2-hydratase n=2 Tax=Alkalisalibacterium limincola TaxID=2699169 RepID=A0A5C8KYU0_9GAMM|nr:carotenoid 1,2-hydratase [Alkalisalibacterium limincola]
MSGMTQWSRGRGALLSALVALSALALAGCVGDDASPRNGGQDLSQLLAAEAATAFAPVTRPARLEFPRDHGPHPAHRIEWWYYTANLRGPGDEAFGVQVALFRFALRSGTEATGWEAGQLYMAHVAISELDGGRFHVDERLARPAAGLAGAQSEPFAAWVETCSARGLSAGGMFPLRLSCPGRNADGEAFGLELELVADKPRVLHGEDGYSEKSDVPGGASYYYAYTRLAARGELQLPGRDAPVPVSGSAWYDHEWGSIGLGDEQAGWDWFSLQLDDGHELMFFHIRDRDGRPVSQRGSLVAPDGAVRAFAEGVVDARPLRTWRSPHSGAQYPVAWRLQSDALDFSLEVHARMDDQEMRTAVQYWEGSIRAEGHHRGRPVAGEGFLELTGYR